MSARRRLRPLMVLLVAAIVIVSAVLVAMPRLDAVGAVDAVVVLGGGSGERLALGRSLAIDRDVPLVLSGDTVSEAAEAGLACGDSLTVEDRAVPVFCVDPDPVTTAGEARGVAALADTEGWDRVVVSTSTFHVNRARVLFAQCLGEDDVDVTGVRSPTNAAVEAYRHTRELLGRLAAITVRRAC